MPTKLQPVRAAKPTTALNFELPTFTFDKESLVAGTNLPVPSREPSPAPIGLQQKQHSNDPLRSHPTTPNNQSQAGVDKGATENGNSSGVGGANSYPLGQQDQSQQAAAGMKRPHHVRRLLSMRSLSQSFNSHGRTDSNVSGSDFGPMASPTGRSRTPSIFGRNSTSTWGARPESRGGMSTMGGKQDGGAEGGRRSLKKRMSSGFWSRRNSMTLARLDESAAEADQRKNRKTPPPQLPEIGELKVKDGDFLNGDDMFKGIEYKKEI